MLSCLAASLRFHFVAASTSWLAVSSACVFTSRTIDFRFGRVVGSLKSVETVALENFRLEVSPALASVAILRVSLLGFTPLVA